MLQGYEKDWPLEKNGMLENVHSNSNKYFSVKIALSFKTKFKEHYPASNRDCGTINIFNF